jgi:hypothetical protein
MINLVGTYWERYEHYCKVTRQSEFNVWTISINDGRKTNIRFRTWQLFKYWKHLPTLDGMLKVGE